MCVPRYTTSEKFEARWRCKPWLAVHVVQRATDRIYQRVIQYPLTNLEGGQYLAFHLGALSRKGVSTTLGTATCDKAECGGKINEVSE